MSRLECAPACVLAVWALSDYGRMRLHCLCLSDLLRPPTGWWCGCCFRGEQEAGRFWRCCSVWVRRRGRRPRGWSGHSPERWWSCHPLSSPEAEASLGVRLIRARLSLSLTSEQNRNHSEEFQIYPQLFGRLSSYPQFAPAERKSSYDWCTNDIRCTIFYFLGLFKRQQTWSAKCTCFGCSKLCEHWHDLVSW